MVFSKLVIEGNAVYEIDEQCMEKRRQRLELLERQERKQNQKSGGSGNSN